MNDLQYVFATIMEDALIKSEFPKEYEQLEKLKRQYSDTRVDLYKKTINKIRKDAKLPK